MQLPFAAFTPQKVWLPPRPEEWPAFGRAKRISFDLENKDEQLKLLGPGCFRKDSHVAGIGVAIDGGPRAYIPIAHKGGDNVENPDQVWRWVKDNAEQFEGDMIGCHVAYDLKWMGAKGVHFKKMRHAYDIIIMETLTYELHRQANMDAIAARLKIPGKDKQLLLKAAQDYGLKNPLAEMHKLPARYVADYNIGDLEMPLKAYPILLRKIEQMGCLELLAIETELTPILVEMYLLGVRVDVPRMERLEQWFVREEKKCCEEISAITCEQIRMGDCDNNNKIGPVLERALGLTFPRSPKGKKILLRDVTLAALSKKHDLVKLVHRARKLGTARAFCPQTFDHLIGDRIHATYNQTRSTADTLSDDPDIELDSTGARTGRMACTHINLTQIPGREAWGPEMRACFLPEEGMQWGSCDYAQQEPRLTTALAAKIGLPQAQVAAQAFLDDELLDNHTFMAQLTGLPRKKAKNIYLGLVYSMGEAKLCRELDLPTQYCVAVGGYKDRQEFFFKEEWEAMTFRQNEVTDEQVSVFECAGPEGKAIIDTFFKRAPFLPALAKLATREANKFGFVRTIMQRHIHFPVGDRGRYMDTHAALNGIIQGSAADQMKKAMIWVKRHYPHLLLHMQVHDMLGFSVPMGLAGRRITKDIGRIMRYAHQDRWMRFRVDSANGRSWGEEEELCYEQWCTNDAKHKDEKWCPQHSPRGALLLAA